MTSSRVEDMSWPTPAEAGHTYAPGFAVQVAELVVAKLKDEGLVHDDRSPLTEQEAAARLSVSERVLRDMIRGFRDASGEWRPPVLASILVGKGGWKGVRVEVAEIDRYLEGQRRLALVRGGGENRGAND